MVLKCSPLKYKRITSIESKSNQNIVLFLDQITDPQNFGAILRVAFFLGVNAVVVEEKNRCPLNNTVSKTSSGALELMDIYCCNKSVELIESNR